MYLKYYLDKKGARVYTFADEGPNGEVPRLTARLRGRCVAWLLRR